MNKKPKKPKKMPNKRVEIYVEMEENETDFPQDLEQLQDEIVLKGYDVELIGTRPDRRKRPQ